MNPDQAVKSTISIYHERLELIQETLVEAQLKIHALQTDHMTVLARARSKIAAEPLVLAHPRINVMPHSRFRILDLAHHPNSFLP